MAVSRVTSKYIINGSNTFFNNAWFCRGFVSATRPSQKEKVDKETCGKILETVSTVKEGTKDVVKEVGHIAEAITGKFTNTTGNMAADAAEKGLDHASKKAETKKTKDVLDTGKAAAEAVKERAEKKET